MWWRSVVHLHHTVFSLCGIQKHFHKHICKIWCQTSERLIRKFSVYEHWYERDTDSSMISSIDGFFAHFPTLQWVGLTYTWIDGKKIQTRSQIYPTYICWGLVVLCVQTFTDNVCRFPVCVTPQWCQLKTGDAFTDFSLYSAESCSLVWNCSSSVVCLTFHRASTLVPNRYSKSTQWY